MTIQDVTTGQTFASVSDAITNSNDGDVIDLSAGTYIEDFPKITHSLTIQGIGGLAHLMTPGQPLNGQAILVQDAPNLTLNDLELSGATVPDNNGAGVRLETGTNLTITNSWIHNNQNGVLTGAIPGATVAIDHSEINNNGDGSGFTHDLYIGVIAVFAVTNDYIHDALGGHEIKSRAALTVIDNNRIQDGSTANSYSIDLPNGGITMIDGNVIEKGQNSVNQNIIHYGGEISPVGPSSLTIENNTVIDDRSGGTPNFVFNQSIDVFGNPVLPTINNDAFYHVMSNQLSNDPFNASGNVFPTTAAPALDTSHPFQFIECFLTGTAILTYKGLKRVEELVVGDDLVTIDMNGMISDTQPIIWIGRRVIENTYRHPTPDNVLPIRIRPNAFGAGSPSKDLYLSPDHSVYWNGVLIPVRLLVNGLTIEQIRFPKVVYYHVELAQHSVIVAENLSVESYLDIGNRSDFTNGQVTTLYPRFVESRREAFGCAPLIVTGPILEEMRRFAPGPSAFAASVHER
jgi:hypothetical protein